MKDASATVIEPGDASEVGERRRQPTKLERTLPGSFRFLARFANQAFSRGDSIYAEKQAQTGVPEAGREYPV